MKPLIVANWKMNPQTLREAKQLFSSVKRGMINFKKAEVIICPPLIYLPSFSSFNLGAQNCFWEQRGAFTGEVSPLMLKGAGCQYVIVGHSERRRYFGETDDIINRKLQAVLTINLTPILCVGETKKDREQGGAEEVIKNQIISDLEGISKARFSKVVIAYEPVWAIGTGNPCDVDEAQKMGLVIRKIISQFYNQALSRKIRILYGGSVDSKNAAGYIKEANFQGLLVGGASLRAKEFIDLIKETC